MNDTYEVESDVDKYIFRIYRADRRSRPDIEFELELLRFLSANGIGVSEPIPGKDGAYLSGFNVMEEPGTGSYFNMRKGTSCRFTPQRTVTDSVNPSAVCIRQRIILKVSLQGNSWIWSFL